MNESSFEWNEAKDLSNRRKPGVSCNAAQDALLDENRIIAEDLNHGSDEQRYYCFGLDEGGKGILTVRFTYRSGRIRKIGAGYWH
jgi:uncharacterized protein